jgi:hypothetical protein
MREDSYGSFGGTAADTLVASDELQIIMRVQGSATRDINLGLELTKVSGTVTNNFFFSGSMDNVVYTNIDTIAYSNASSGTTDLRLDNFNYPYLKVVGVAGATAQKASYQLFYINRQD